MSIMHCSLLSLGCAFGFTPPGDRVGLTALRALKIAQRRLRPEVRAKLLTVSSPRTDNSLSPTAWRFVFFDAATTGNCRIVTVAAKTSSEHPDTVEAFSTAKTGSAAGLHPIPQNKIVVDSDKALEQTRVSSKLKGVQAAQYFLVQDKAGAEPLWMLHFFGDGREPVAQFQIGAKTGVVELTGNGVR
jgi:hypothetical protein